MGDEASASTFPVTGGSGSASGSRRGTEPFARTLPLSGDAGRAAAPAAPAIAHYRLLRVLGTGAMGAVWEAVDEKLGRRVAVKVLSTPHGSAEATARFATEARTAARLRHPNIVPVHDVGDDGERRWLVMDLVGGGTLAELVARRQLTWRQRARLVERIARAVQHAHEQGVVHRDLKPGNILIEPPGSETRARTRAGDDACGEPLVVDFGLSKDLRGEAGLSRDGQPMGTPAYMPPEQAAGAHEKVGPRSDVYGLGAILYELLTGRAPFVGESAVAILKSVLADEPPDPRALAPHAPRDLETICLRCLAKNPLKRYASAAAVADDLAAWLAGDAISARPIGAVERCVRRVRKQPAAYAVGALSLAVLLTTVALFLWRLDQRRRDAESALADLRASQVERSRLEGERVRRWHLVRDLDFAQAESRDAVTVVSAGRHEFADGWLHAWGGTPQLAMLKQPIAGDIALEFDCRQEGDYLNDVSCMLGVRQLPSAAAVLPNCYELKYGGWDNSRSSIARNGLPLVERIERPLTAGRVFHARAERVGDRLTYSIDGVVVLDARDDAPLPSSDDAFVGLFGYRAHTYWRNVRLWHLDEPAAADLLDVADRMLAAGRADAAEALYREVAGAAADPERRDRARAGIAAAAPMVALRDQLPDIVRRLRQAWPTAEISLAAHGLRVAIPRCGIADLMPLAGLRVAELDCAEDPIGDLAPIAGAPLRWLDISGTRVASLATIAGAPLTLLRAARTPLGDLGPLAGMPLEDLAIDATAVTSLAPLKGMPLRQLSCSGCPLEDLSPLAGMQLIGLNINDCRVRSLAPLTGMHLVTLNCSGNRIESLAPLAGMPLWMLACHANRIESLAPLADSTPHMLGCSFNRITSLAPIARRPPDSLDVSDNPLASIRDLIASPPRWFLFDLDGLPEAELDAAQAAWTALPRAGELVHQLRVERAIRAGDRRAAQALATPHRGHTYLLATRTRTWSQAKAACARVGGHPLTLADGDEFTFALSITNPGWPVWLDFAVDPEPRWLTGEPCAFTLRPTSAAEWRAGEGYLLANDGWFAGDADIGRAQMLIEWDDAP